MFSNPSVLDKRAPGLNSGGLLVDVGRVLVLDLSVVPAAENDLLALAKLVRQGSRFVLRAHEVLSCGGFSDEVLGVTRNRGGSPKDIVERIHGVRVPHLLSSVLNDGVVIGTKDESVPLSSFSGGRVLGNLRECESRLRCGLR